MTSPPPGTIDTEATETEDPMTPIDAEIEAWFARPPRQPSHRSLYLGAALAASIALGGAGAIVIHRDDPKPAPRREVMRLDPLYVTAPREVRQTLTVYASPR
jgi:hypothetical protein